MRDTNNRVIPNLDMAHLPIQRSQDTLLNRHHLDNHILSQDNMNNNNMEVHRATPHLVTALPSQVMPNLATHNPAMDNNKPLTHHLPTELQDMDSHTITPKFQDMAGHKVSNKTLILMPPELHSRRSTPTALDRSIGLNFATLSVA